MSTKPTTQTDDTTPTPNDNTQPFDPQVLTDLQAELAAVQTTLETLSDMVDGTDITDLDADQLSNLSETNANRLCDHADSIDAELEALPEGAIAEETDRKIRTATTDLRRFARQIKMTGKSYALVKRTTNLATTLLLP